MAHFAKIDENGIVNSVIVVSNDAIENKSFPESDEIGQNFIKSIKIDGTWVQTSYNNNFRKQFAGVGFFYDKDNDVFIAPKPFDSWILNEDYDWAAPIPMPETGGPWIWDEENQQWEEQQ